MTPQLPFSRPPRIATWLIASFAPSQQTESITGDLLEEFSDLASKFGQAFAYRWYWRQSIKTTAYLITNTFRVAPWSIVGAVLGGFLLLQLGARLPETVVIALLRTQRPYSTAQYNAYVFWVTDGILIVGFIESMLVGCIVAIASRGREVVATTTLSLVLVALNGAAWVHSATFWPEYAIGVPRMLVTSLESPLMIVTGGAIVRIARSAPARFPSAI